MFSYAGHMPFDPELLGVLGSLILVIGAAWPVQTSGHPALSRKNQLFAVGNVCMFGYGLSNYFLGGSIFFILLQVLVLTSTVLMILNTDDVLDASILACVGAAMAVYGLFLFRDYTTVVFVVGLVTLGVGFALNMASMWRQVALAAGSVLIAWFSYTVNDPIFLWLNVFFALFSGFHAYKLHLSNR